MTHPESGEMRINGQPVTLRNNHEAIKHGSAMSLKIA